MTTLTRLAEIEARAVAATPGPWIAAARGSGTVGWPVVASTGRSICAINYVHHSAIDPAVPGDKAFNAESKRNATFIAHARQDIPALLSHARALEAEKAALEAERERFRALVKILEEPIPMLLFCPQCGMQHIDQIETTLVWTGGAVKEPSHEETTWDNPPHRSHLCAGCGHIWRPCDRATTGVAAITTKGQADGSAYPATLIALEAERDRLKAECERLRGGTIAALHAARNRIIKRADEHRAQPDLYEEYTAGLDDAAGILRQDIDEMEPSHDD